MKPMPKNYHGFTLVELLVVVSIITILIVVVYESLDPIRRFADARNARRWSQVNSLSTSIYRYIIQQGSFPSGIDEQKKQIGTAIDGCDNSCIGAQSSCINLQKELEDFMPILPIELNGGTPERTGYAISKKANNNVITISSCGAENGAQIFVMR